MRTVRISLQSFWFGFCLYLFYLVLFVFFFFFKQKTAYEMRISDWSSDVCSSDLLVGVGLQSQIGRHGIDPANGGAGFRQAESGGHAVDQRGEIQDRKSVV